MSEVKQEYLYHYTNLSSLALILKDKSIKFNPLTGLDDSEEEKINDSFQHLGKYCFVSSWTEDEDESIPMWNLYTNLHEGIRIRLPKNPFEEYLFNEIELLKLYQKDDFQINSKGYYAVKPFKEIFEKKHFITSHIQKNLLKKVIYTNDKAKLYPQIICGENEEIKICLDKLGVFKNDYWKFQNEWRYILNILPFGYEEIMQSEFDNDDKAIKLKLFYGENLPFDFYFLKLDPIKFEDMQITLSPKISEGNRLIAEMLVEKFNPKVKIDEKINESKLLKKIR